MKGNSAQVLDMSYDKGKNFFVDTEIGIRETREEMNKIKTEISDLEVQRKQLQQRMETLKTQAKAARDAASRVQNQLQQRRRALAETREQLEVIEERKARKEKEKNPKLARATDEYLGDGS